MFLEDLERGAIEHCGISRDEILLVGVSGGADSLALMVGLKALGFNLVIAHLDHAIRPESPQEAAFVEEIATSLGLPFFRARIDVQKRANENGQSLEEAARVCRYRFLFKQARACKAQAVAVAHHADDQVETVLMHFLRGAALPGLSGMSFRRVMTPWDPEIPLVRPLLEVWREEIEQYVRDVDLTACIDPSNQDTTYFRNRLRHELIPALETYNPQVKPILWRMAEVIREEDHFLNKLAESAMQDSLISNSENRVELPCSTIRTFDKALQRRVLRQAISMLRPDLRNVGFDAIERGLDFIAKPSESGEMDLVARLNVAIVKDILIIKTWEATLPDWGKPLLPDSSFSRSLEIDQSVFLSHGWRITAELVSDPDETSINALVKLKKNEVWCDLDAMQMPLTVRGRKKGERWQPFGMGGHTQKLSDFFINQKIPEHLRDIWPLVCSETHVVWVVGERPSEAFKVKPETRRIIRLVLLKT